MADPCKKARPAQDCQEEEKIAVVKPIVPKGLRIRCIFRVFPEGPFIVRAGPQ